MSAYNIEPYRFKKEVYNKRYGIYFNGELNDYPDLVYYSVDNSPTASSCLDLCRKFIFGKGFGDNMGINSFVVNFSDSNTLYNLTTQAINSIVLFKEAFIKAIYTLGEGNIPVISALKVLDNKNIRYCYRDDFGYISHVAFSNNWDKVKSNKDYTKYFIHNDNIALDDIVGKDKNELWDQNYLNKLNNSGVVYILRTGTSSTVNIKSRINSVLDDCVIEDKASTFKKNGITKGHFGREILVLPQKVNTDHYDIRPDIVPPPSFFNEKRLQDNEDAEFKSLLGADNVGGMLIYRSQNEDLSKAIATFKIDSDISPDLFKDTEVTARENIASVFFNTPTGLIRSSDALFGNSGEAYRQMKLFLQENTQEERIKIHMFLSKILAKMPRFVSSFGELPELTPLIQ